MHILHLGKHYWPDLGGIETATQQLAELGIEAGSRVECVVSTRRGQKDAPNTKMELINRVKVIRHRAKAHIFSAPIVSQFFWTQLSKADVIHLHLPNPIAEIALLKYVSSHPRSQARIIPYLHALPVSQGILGRIWFRCITSAILNRSHAVMVSNTRWTSLLTERSPWISKLKVVPFHVDCLSPGQLLTDLAIRRRSNTLFSVGRLVSYKGYEILIRAWALSMQRSGLAGLQLKIAGEGPERPNLERLIIELGLTSSVKLLGACSEDEKLSHFRTSRLFVAPSTSDAETFGISILEALAHGLPVITTTLKTGVAELAREGECGAVVRPGSIAELSDALERLSAMPPDAYDQISMKNLRFSEEFYSRRSCVEKYTRIILPHD